MNTTTLHDFWKNAPRDQRRRFRDEIFSGRPDNAWQVCVGQKGLSFPRALKAAQCLQSMGYQVTAEQILQELQDRKQNKAIA